jgi:hypothetical protein
VFGKAIPLDEGQPDGERGQCHSPRCMGGRRH